MKQSGRYTVILGAGTNGRSIASRLSTDSFLGLKLIGFIDDDPQKAGRMIGGTKVLGTRKDLPFILEHFQIREVLVAIVQPRGELLREVVQVCRSFNIRPRIIHSSAQPTEADSHFGVIQEIGLNELMNRPKREMDLGALRGLIKNKRVLVTGAGGSIGSELARQIAVLEPRLLLLLDHSEHNLYQIDNELRLSPSETNLIHPLLVDIKDSRSLGNAFKQYVPEIVFHAAAYKHVHLVENNPFPSILNNVLGTKNLLDLSEKVGVEAFVLISTDKAVNPAGVMGATKRICELLVTEMGEKTGKRFTSVRFGNVLGSSGSLIPLLKRQVENGEPLTITHRDMTRYFMLIPEAVSLVLKAATIASPGDITILRMGEPVKIVDVAKSLLALMGKTEEQNPIVFTGLRPGEKLFEELYFSGKEVQTQDPDILVLPGGDMAEIKKGSDKQIWTEVTDIVKFAERADREALFKMNALVKSKYLNFDSSETETKENTFL